MDVKRKELNRLINKMYRQLGKDLFDDLEDDTLQIKDYKKQAEKIKSVIKAILSLEEVETLEDETLEMGVETLEPQKNDEGLYEYRFCSHCHAGNNPEAIYCIRCQLIL